MKAVCKRGCVKGACETGDPRKCKAGTELLRQERKTPTASSPSAPGNPPLLLLDLCSGGQNTQPFGVCWEAGLVLWCWHISVQRHRDFPFHQHLFLWEKATFLLNTHSHVKVVTEEIITEVSKSCMQSFTAMTTELRNITQKSHGGFALLGVV